jgi:hypothetical protein
LPLKLQAKTSGDDHPLKVVTAQQILLRHDTPPHCRGETNKGDRGAAFLRRPKEHSLNEILPLFFGCEQYSNKTELKR